MPRRKANVAPPQLATKLKPCVVVWRDSAFSEDEHPGPIMIASIGFVTHIDSEGNITLAQDMDDGNSPRHRKTILKVNIVRLQPLKILKVPELVGE